GYVEISCAVQSETIREKKLRAIPGSIRAAALTGRPGQGAYESARNDFANRVVPRIGYIDIGSAVHSHAVRRVEARIERKTIGGAALPGTACQGRYCSGWSNHADGMVSLIGDIDIGG